MIRIDELYDNTFWPWMQGNIPGLRLFYCDPPGHTSVNNLFNRSSNQALDFEYVFMHDQEPVDLELYRELFDRVRFTSNNDLHDGFSAAFDPDTTGDPKDNGVCYVHLAKPVIGSVIVSEKGDNVKELCKHYGWRSYYYFWHGWAALDWYRGYDKTFLTKRAGERTPTRTFMSPNRIVGGKRDHRVLFLNQVFKRGLEDNYISAPRVCPEEGVAFN
jgi:hypothetical protein